MNFDLGDLREHLYHKEKCVVLNLDQNEEEKVKIIRAFLAKNRPIFSLWDEYVILGLRIGRKSFDSEGEGPKERDMFLMGYTDEELKAELEARANGG